MSEVNDRGTIKWTSLMMPEHIKMLNDMWKDQEKKPKPVLDEQEMEEINMKLQLAIHNDLSVEIKYYSDYDYQTTKGKLKNIDTMNKYVQLHGIKINFHDILDVSVE